MILEVTATATLLGLTWSILIQKGGVLQWIPQWINTNIKIYTIQVGLQCSYCFAGQCALWFSVWCVSMCEDIEVFWSVPLSINLTYLIYNYVYKNANK